MLNISKLFNIPISNYWEFPNSSFFAFWFKKYYQLTID
nr:MAG TPA: hypothetical protein [Caudoviricetes sp.]